MRYVKKYIDYTEYDFLEVTIYDDADKEDLSRYAEEKNVLVSIGDVEFLKEFKSIERLIITPGQPPKDISGIFANMTSLKSLKLDYVEDEPGTDWCIDLSVFPSLQYLFSRSSYNFQGTSPTLKTLVVMEWYQGDLTALHNSAIDSLRICGGKLRTLHGLGTTSLCVLSLSNLRYLKDISDAQRLQIKVLEIENCNQIASLEEFSSDTLEYLMLEGRKPITSGQFLGQFPTLKRVILDIPIEDGDLSSLDSLEKAVLITNRRNFNRKDEELPKTSCPYILPDIPMWRWLYSDRTL